MSIAALILGVVALCFSIIGVFVATIVMCIIAMICGIVAIIMGVKTRYENQGLAGLIVGSIGTAMGFIEVIIMICMLAAI